MGFYVTNKNFMDADALIDALVSDLIANGFTQIVAANTFGIKTPAILEVTSTVDPLAATQPWRIAIGHQNDTITLWSGTGDQLKDTGEITVAALRHAYCNYADVREGVPHGYILSLSDHGLVINIFNQSYADSYGSGWVRKSNVGIQFLHHSRVIDDQVILPTYGIGIGASYDGKDFYYPDYLDIGDYSFFDIASNKRPKGSADSKYVLTTSYGGHVLHTSKLDGSEGWDWAYTGYSDNVYMRSIASDGSTFVVAGSTTTNRGRISSSSDGGKTWTARYASPSNTYGSLDVIYGNGVWVAPGYSTIMVSTNGAVTWTEKRPVNIYFYSVAHNGENGATSIFTVVAANGRIFTSADGDTWTEQTSPISTDLYGVWYCENNALWVAVGATGSIITSTDAVTWSVVQNGETTTRTLYGICEIENRLVATGSGVVMISDDAGTSWEVTHGNSDQNGMNHINGKTDGKGNKEFVAVGYAGNVSYSDDGIHWLPSETPGAYNLSVVETNDSFSTNNRWVCGGADLDGFYWSDDRVNWTYTSIWTYWNHTYDIKFSGGKWVAIGYGQSGQGAIATSNDGQTWNMLGHAFPSSVNGYWPQQIAHNGKYGDDSLWIISRLHGRMAWSVDGETWLDSDLSGWSGWSGEGFVEHNGNTTDGIWLIVCNDGNVKRSFDGKRWEDMAAWSYGLPNRAFTGVTAVNGKFYVSTNGREVYCTEDGKNWKIVSQYTPATYYEHTDKYRAMDSENYHGVVDMYDGTVSLTTKNVNRWRVNRIVPINSTVCIQRPVDKTTGTVLTSGKAPVVQMVTDAAGGYLMSILRESDITQPTDYQSISTEGGATAFPIPMHISAGVEPTDSDGNSITVFPYGFSTERHFYPYEIDMVGATRANITPAMFEADITMYGETTPRTYMGAPHQIGSNTPATPTRPIILVNGGGI